MIFALLEIFTQVSLFVHLPTLVVSIYIISVSDPFDSKEIMNPKEDHVRYYGLCNKDKTKVLLDGKGVISKEQDHHIL